MQILVAQGSSKAGSYPKRLRITVGSRFNSNFSVTIVDI